MVLSSTENWFNNANNSMGLVSLATLIVMFFSDMWQLDSSPRTWVRWMVYLDVAAFAVVYAGSCVDDILFECWQRNAFELAGGIIWSFKDCFKYGYMAFKASTICGLRSPWPCYVTGGVSLLLYWIVLIAGIGFKSPMCEPLTHNKGPLVVLYVYWTVVDVVASAMIIHRVRKVILKSKAVKIDYSEFYQLKFREETRLLFVSVGMTVVTILEIFAAVQDSFSTNLISLWRIVFVYIQLVMVLTSQKVTEGSGGASLSDPKSFSSNAIDKGLITREQKVSKVQSRTANMGSGPNLQHESFEL